MLKKIIISVAIFIVILTVFLKVLNIPVIEKGLFTFQFEYEKLKKNVVSVEIVEIKESYYPSLDYNVLMTIDEDRKDDFFYDLSNLKYKPLFGDPVSLHGKCIKVLYTNGDYEMICQEYIEKYNKDNVQILKRYKYCDEDYFEDLIEKYLVNR